MASLHFLFVEEAWLGLMIRLPRVFGIEVAVMTVDEITNLNQNLNNDILNEDIHCIRTSLDKILQNSSIVNYLIKQNRDLEESIFSAFNQERFKGKYEELQQVYNKIISLLQNIENHAKLKRDLYGYYLQLLEDVEGFLLIFQGLDEIQTTEQPRKTSLQIESLQFGFSLISKVFYEKTRILIGSPLVTLSFSILCKHFLEQVENFKFVSLDQNENDICSARKVSTRNAIIAILSKINEIDENRESLDQGSLEYLFQPMSESAKEDLINLLSSWKDVTDDEQQDQKQSLEYVKKSHTFRNRKFFETDRANS
jgi:hypothetical protein